MVQLELFGKRLKVLFALADPRNLYLKFKKWHGFCKKLKSKDKEKD